MEVRDAVRETLARGKDGGRRQLGRRRGQLCSALLCLKEERGPSKREEASRLRIKMNTSLEYPDVYPKYPDDSRLSGLTPGTSGFTMTPTR